MIPGGFTHHNVQGGATWCAAAVVTPQSGGELLVNTMLVSALSSLWGDLQGSALYLSVRAAMQKEAFTAGKDGGQAKQWQPINRHQSSHALWQQHFLPCAQVDV